ncbi:unnamed protein product, partial [Thlaspi arvense]
IATFEMEYGHWIEEQQRQNCELRKVLQAHISDIELRMLVETILEPQLEPLTDQQHLAVDNLRHSSQQAEDALTQGMDRLQQTLAQSITADLTDAGDYRSQMTSAIENLNALESFVLQVNFPSPLAKQVKLYFWISIC